MVKVTGHINGLTEADFDRLAAAGGGSRYEVVLDHTDGDHHGLELHFRLVEENATQQFERPPGRHERGGVNIRLEEPEIGRAHV